MMSFEEQWDNDGFLSNCSMQDAKHFYEVGAASRQAELDDLIELNRLYKIALSQSVNRTSKFVHEKIIELESKLEGKENEKTNK